MTIKKFFAFSIVAHAIILFGIYFIPVAKEKQPGEFFTMLISPEELPKPENEMPQGKIQPVPSLPPVSKIAPLTQGSPIRPGPIPSPEKPVVPGEGKDTGKPLPEGLYPKTGNEDKTEDGSDIKKSLKPGYSEREKIFDKSIIGDLAKKDLDKYAKRDKSITLDTKEYRYAGYMRKLKEKIESIWVYPPEAKVRGIYGDLKIQFTIKKNGRLGAIELVRTSGYKMLDDAAMRALKDGEPYWPLPDEWGMESYTILGHFIYNIYGYYVR